MNNTIKYKDEDQCPCCGRGENQLIAKIAEDSSNNLQLNMQRIEMELTPPSKAGIFLIGVSVLLILALVGSLLYLAFTNVTGINLNPIGMLAVVISTLISIHISETKEYKGRKVLKINEHKALINEGLEKYYRTLRYCKHCHVVFDKEGYYYFANKEAIKKLSLNAGIFDGDSLELRRRVNQNIERKQINGIEL